MRIVDDEGKIIGMIARFHYFPDRDLVFGDKMEGRTNQVLELEPGTYNITICPPHDFTPKKMKIILQDTTALFPMEVRYEKI